MKALILTTEVSLTSAETLLREFRSAGEEAHTQHEDYSVQHTRDGLFTVFEVLRKNDSRRLLSIDPTTVIPCK